MSIPHGVSAFCHLGNYRIELGRFDLAIRNGHRDDVHRPVCGIRRWPLGVLRVHRIGVLAQEQHASGSHRENLDYGRLQYPLQRPKRVRRARRSSRRRPSRPPARPRQSTLGAAVALTGVSLRRVELDEQAEREIRLRHLDVIAERHLYARSERGSEQI